MKSQFSSQGRNPAMGRGAFTRGGSGRGMFDAGSPEIIAKILLGFFLGPPGWLWLLYTLVRNITSVGGQERGGVACENRAVVATPSPAEVSRPRPAALAVRAPVMSGATPPPQATVAAPPPATSSAVSSGDELVEAEAVAVSTPAADSAPALPMGAGAGRMTAGGDVKAPPAVARRPPPAFKRVSIAAVAPVRRDEASPGASSADPDGRDAGSVSLSATSPTEPPHEPFEDAPSVPVSSIPLADDRDTALVDEPDFLYQEPDEADQDWLVSHEEDLT